MAPLDLHLLALPEEPTQLWDTAQLELPTAQLHRELMELAELILASPARRQEPRPPPELPVAHLLLPLGQAMELDLEQRAPLKL